MMTEMLGTPPVLSTPDTHIFSETAPGLVTKHSLALSNADFEIKYEILRTVEEIRRHKWTRIALQFPDSMLPDSARVFQLLARRTRSKSPPSARSQREDHSQGLPDELASLKVTEHDNSVKLTILADTSYGSCCVDEIAAEHVAADAVIHYGQACLSPTARLPVIHVFTEQELNHQQVVDAFAETFPDLHQRVIVTADVTYSSHIEDICRILGGKGYENIFTAKVIHDPSSLVPNRTIPDQIQTGRSTISDWQLFHISEPPTSLLLTLSSRVSHVYIYPTAQENSEAPTKLLLASTTLILRRRYALVTSLASVGVWGILINTLSVKNYLHIVDHVKSRLAGAGKKSYLFVVGKLNAAKVANFGEIGGWVVIGCWESSLVDSKEFYRPVITPFELDLALQRDEDRIWTGEWRSDFQGILDDHTESYTSEQRSELENGEGSDERHAAGDYDSEEESAPPEFDLRTGRYISSSRPLRRAQIRLERDGIPSNGEQSSALTKRAKLDVVALNGVASPAAEFLKTHRTWQGLGSDFEIKYEEEELGSAIEEGRTGVARGYIVGDSGIS